MKIHKDDKNVLTNILGAYFIRGAAILLSLFSMPAYIRYFDNQIVLGIWYTMLSILNWIMMFDLGIGNGLRNRITVTLTQKNKKETQEYITSAYVSIFFLALLVAMIYYVIQKYINWNDVFNVSEDIIPATTLRICMFIIVIGVLIRFVLGLISSILYALQKSMINNFLTLLTNLLLYIYILIAPHSSIAENLIGLSIAHVFLSNFPLLIVSLIIFLKPLKEMRVKFSSFRIDKARDVVKTGTILLWLQIVAMVVLSTHAFLITKFCGPEFVVDYNIYYKVYGTMASLITLTLTPIWSAVTKAQAENNYAWIIKIHKLLMFLPLVTFLLDLMTLPILQIFFDIWLNTETITVTLLPMFAMSLFNTMYVWQQVNTNISNGLGEFKTQSVLMSLAAIIMVPLSYALSKFLDDWSGVLIACAISLVPYCLIQPLMTIKVLKNKSQFIMLKDNSISN